MTQKILIHSLGYYMPVKIYAQYFNHDTVVIEAQENYQKRSFRNKSAILSPTGQQLLSIPLSKGKHNNAPVKSIDIANETDWRRQHQKAIMNNYKASPFLSYYPELTSILDDKYQKLFDLNLKIHNLILRILDLSSRVYTLSSTYHPNNRYNLGIKDSAYTGNTPYPQVFDSKLGFTDGLSILDLIFHLGPESSLYLKRLALTSDKN